MIRKQILLTQSQVDFLAKEVKQRTGESETSFIRRLLDKEIRRQRQSKRSSPDYLPPAGC
jgi:hypothetical protein